MSAVALLVPREAQEALLAGELNALYARLEEMHNCLRSNWEWFVSAANAGDAVEAVLARVEQGW